MILEKFVASLSPEIRTFLKENEVKTKRANIWIAAHHVYSKHSSQAPGKKQSPAVKSNNTQVPCKSPSPV